jgi:hypothetical protein
VEVVEVVPPEQQVPQPVVELAQLQVLPSNLVAMLALFLLNKLFDVLNNAPLTRAIHNSFHCVTWCSVKVLKVFLKYR